MSDDFPSKLSSDYVAAVAPNELLKEIRNWGASTASVATKHPYGFWVILLHQTDTEEWRFHLWAENRPPTDGMPAPIHTHDKIVDSRVLLGELQNVAYDVTPVQRGGLPVYEARHSADKYTAQNKNILIKTVERRAVIVNINRIMVSGESYSVPAHSFHEAKVCDGLFTCTIVRMHSRIPGSVQILGADGYPDIIEFRRASAPVAEVIAAELQL